METEIKELTDLHSNLELTMKHLLDHLREILASIHEERIVHGRNEAGQLKEVLHKREELLSGFNRAYQDFMYFLKQLTQELGDIFSLFEGLEWLQTHLDVESVELLLMSEQLMSLGEEIQVETKNLINYLEHKSGFDSVLVPHLLKQPKPARLLVGVVDDELGEE